MSQNIGPGSAWKAKQQEIDLTLREVKNRRIIHGLYLCAPPKSGLSDTLIQHVVSQSKKGQAPDRVIYFASSAAKKEAVEMAARKDAALREAHDELRLYVLEPDFHKTLRDLSQSDPDNTFGTSTVVMVEVGMSPSVEEELLFGRLLLWMRQALERRNNGEDIHMALFLLGSLRSERTYASFSKIMTVRDVSISGLHNDIAFEYLQPAQGHVTEFADIAAACIKGGKQRVFSASYPEQMCFQLEAMNFRDVVEYTPQKKLAPVAVDLGAFLSNGEVDSVYRDRRTGQLVKGVRQLTRWELQQDMAWVYGSTSPTPARFLTMYTREQYLERLEGDEAAGPAFTTDIMQLVLATIQYWPGRELEDIPQRQPADSVAWADALYRLIVLQCVTVDPDQESVYQPTSRGSIILALLLDGHEWNEAYILALCGAKTQSSALSEPARLVLIRMAAIIGMGFQKFCGPAYPEGREDEPPPDADYREQVADIVQERAAWGALWFAAGVFIKEEARYSFNFPQEDGSMVKRLGEHFLLGLTWGKMLKQRVERYHELCGLSMRSDRWSRIPLHADEVAEIDKSLLLAFLHNTVVCKPEQPDSSEPLVARECVSYERVLVTQKDELLPLERAITGGNFCAVYLDLSKTDAQYIVSQLTIIPGRAIRAIEAITEMKWPYMVTRT
ncbi:hypothetical protein F5Y15DRAFT_429299 [Xylariaceae sp. FL0016]|nr:hypothetical protein F5Y15DRAFT_429299 [Xylariaceae sp. FL0016]